MGKLLLIGFAGFIGTLSRYWMWRSSVSTHSYPNFPGGG